MPNTREKLIELLSNAPFGIYKKPMGSYLISKSMETLADHLIANGVTISNLETVNKEWIPVTERLPDAFHSVLAHMPGESPMPTVHEGYISRDGIWVAGNFKRDPGEVTHWMPLPEPPKE